MTTERLILDKLQLVHPRMLRENTLWSDVRLDDESISLSELRRNIRNLETKNQVTVVPSDDGTRIKISPDGLARLSE